ncbi:MAG: hypothetical protein H6Q60_99 [Oscillospiraceae bacterium]|nr:hypothetical protein [Oscillospiraceae bacterium]
MSATITFAVGDSSLLHRLPLGDTMLHFIESDFTYFREQCVESVNRYQSTGAFAPERTAVLKEYIRGCHPYCSAAISSDFDQIAMDCIIDYLCETDEVGLEELWVRTLSSTDAFGRGVFHRITEYKTGYAINQWTNLLRMQKYAASKLEFLFHGEAASRSEYEARKLYFDMAFMLTAQELGCDAEALPQVKRYSVPLLPGSASILKNAVNAIRPQVKPLTEGRKITPPGKGRDCVHDQTAGVISNLMMNVQRPLLPELRQIMKAYGGLPAEVYVPSCLKAILDLEFDKLIESDLLLQSAPETGSYRLVSRDGIPVVPMTAEESLPMEENPAPVVLEADLKVYEKAMNEEENPAPVVLEAAPEAEESVPVAEEAVPEAEEPVPVAEETVPAEEESVPTAEEAAPEAEEPTPMVEVWAFHAQELEPETEEAVPMVEVRAFEAEELEPVAEELVPVAEEAAPEAEEPVPAEKTIDLVKEIPFIMVEAPTLVDFISSIHAEAPAPAANIPSIKVGTTAPAAGIPSIKAEQVVPFKPVPPEEPQISATEGKPPVVIPEDGFERVKRIRTMAADPGRTVSKVRTPEEINMRCNELWDAVRKSVGSYMTEDENREWVKALIEIRRSIGAGEMTPEDLDQFLDATEDVYGIAVRL